MYRMLQRVWVIVKSLCAIENMTCLSWFDIHKKLISILIPSVIFPTVLFSFFFFFCMSVVTPSNKPLKQPTIVCHFSDHYKCAKYKLQQSAFVNVLGNEHKFNSFGIQFRFFPLTMASFTVFWSLTPSTWIHKALNCMRMC